MAKKNPQITVLSAFNGFLHKAKLKPVTQQVMVDLFPQLEKVECDDALVQIFANHYKRMKS